MKFRYLGTAASEGWPALFCNCEYCLKAKKARRKEPAHTISGDRK